MLKNRTFMIAAGFALIAVICWSGNWVLGRAIRSEIPPIGLSFWRWVTATVILLPVGLRAGKAEWKAAFAKWYVVMGLALFGASLFQTMIYIGLRSTEATNALLLNSTAPLFVILFAWLALGTRPNSRQMLGIAVSFIGVSVLVGRGDVNRLLAMRFNAGDIWVMSAIVIWGAYSVLLKFKPAGVSPMMLVFLTSLCGALILLPVYIWDVSLGHVVHINKANIGSIFYTGLFASVVAFLAYNAAVERIGPNKTIYFLHLMPVSGAILSFIFLDEQLAMYHVIGFAIVLSGVLYATTGRAE
ncbi:MAG: DMT family transporter [Proteobacteria bacterium]|nr:DMT family transporter [Pseudomonadota bacterium]